MAFLSKQSNTNAQASSEPTSLPEAVNGVTVEHKASSALIVPRLSEKSSAANQLNKYIFTVFGKMNKVELKKSVEKMYGVKIANVNMVTMKAKTRRFGKTVGKLSGYKKAIVTLTPDSKKIDTVEPS